MSNGSERTRSRLARARERTPSELARTRKLFATMAITAVAIGATVLLYRGPARELVRGHVGDVAATLLVFALIGLVSRARITMRATVTFAIACAIELGQTMWHTIAAKSFSGELFLGTTFDWWDLVAYAIGVAVAVLWERWHDARDAMRSADSPRGL